MAKKPTIGTCVYCRISGPVTEDHVPPQCLFPKPRPADLITVPACTKCNSQRWSKEDEYFRLMLCLREDVADQPAVQMTAMPAIMRSLQKPAKIGFRKALLAKTAPRRLVTPAGIDLGVRPTYNVDLDRLNRVAARIVVGLFFHETGRYLPADWGAVAWQSGAFAPEHQPAVAAIAVEALKGSVFNSIADGAFRYRCRFFPEQPDGSAWGLVFFEKVGFFGMTAAQQKPSGGIWKGFV